MEGAVAKVYPVHPVPVGGNNSRAERVVIEQAVVRVDLLHHPSQHLFDWCWESIMCKDIWDSNDNQNPRMHNFSLHDNRLLLQCPQAVCLPGLLFCLEDTSPKCLGCHFVFLVDLATLTMLGHAR
jgi:hypothetical protein